MSSSTSATTTAQSSGSSLALPVSAIVCISIGAYLVLILIFLIIRSILLSRGLCTRTLRCFGKEDEPCCDTCCAELADCCNCCASPSINACLDSICPARQKMDCVDIIMCQCCEACSCCGNQQVMCGDCMCQCNCDSPECQGLDCCCFQFHSRHQYPLPTFLLSEALHGGTTPGLVLTSRTGDWGPMGSSLLIPYPTTTQPGISSPRDGGFSPRGDPMSPRGTGPMSPRGDPNMLTLNTDTFGWLPMRGDTMMSTGLSMHRNSLLNAGVAGFSPRGNPAGANPRAQTKPKTSAEDDRGPAPARRDSRAFSPPTTGIFSSRGSLSPRSPDSKLTENDDY